MACSETPKIIYFNMKGLGELPRLLLAQAGVEFEDRRVSFEEWPQLKKELDLPFGLPGFEIRGKRYCQSLAIVNYIARKHGLYGDTPEEQLKIDMIGQCLHDVSAKLPFRETDAQKKKEKLDELFDNVYPDLLGYVERHLLPEDGFVLGDKLCLSDIGIMRMVEVLEQMRPKSMEKYPKMTRIAAKTEALPNIADWIEKRPKTDM